MYSNFSMGMISGHGQSIKCDVDALVSLLVLALMLSSSFNYFILYIAIRHRCEVSRQIVVFSLIILKDQLVVFLINTFNLITTNKIEHCLFFKCGLLFSTSLY
ncbi:hypothetical protein EDC96DRAFT_545561 [Choanephora cucurbitarum]|nr:hypothetical protein EDC96DRAFT_545561 [Choanephora cucurbitarum]